MIVCFKFINKRETYFIDLLVKVVNVDDPTEAMQIINRLIWNGEKMQLDIVKVICREKLIDYFANKLAAAT